MGFDAWVSSDTGSLDIATNHGGFSIDIDKLGLEQETLDAGGLERKICAYRLPSTPLRRELDFTRTIA